MARPGRSRPIRRSHKDDFSLSGVAAISVASRTRVAVGGSLIEHWDGGVMESGLKPLPSSNAFLQCAVAAVSTKDVWAVGRWNDGPLIEHWDGATWKIVPDVTPPGSYGGLTGVSAASANDVWAVGSGVSNGAGGCGVDTGALIEHWDGARWSSVPFANPPGATYGSVVQYRHRCFRQRRLGGGRL